MANQQDAIFKKPKGIDICGTPEGIFIIRCDRGCYYKIWSLRDEKDNIERFNLHCAFQDGEHFIGLRAGDSEPDKFICIKGNYFYSVKTLRKDIRSVVNPLHPTYQGGDSYFSRHNQLYIIKHDDAEYFRAGNLDGKHFTLPVNLHDTLKCGIYYFARDDYFYIVKALQGDLDQLVYYKTNDLENDGGKPLPISQEVIKLLSPDRNDPTEKKPPRPKLDKVTPVALDIEVELFRILREGFQDNFLDDGFEACSKSNEGLFKKCEVIYDCKHPGNRSTGEFMKRFQLTKPVRRTGSGELEVVIKESTIEQITSTITSQTEAGFSKVLSLKQTITASLSKMSGSVDETSFNLRLPYSIDPGKEGVVTAVIEIYAMKTELESLTFKIPEKCTLHYHEKGKKCSWRVQKRKPISGHNKLEIARAHYEWLFPFYDTIVQ